MKSNLLSSLQNLIHPSATIAAITFALAASAADSFAASQPNVGGPSTKPTIVLVHGAFAESSSWNGVASRLIAQGYPVIAAAVPLRGLQSDASYIAALFQSIQGPIVAVGHSYGGLVISDAAAGIPNVKALVYVAAFALESGESAADLDQRFPGSTLGPALAPPVLLQDGSKDLYIQPEKFRAQFAADVPADTANLMAATQRPIVEQSLHEAAKSASWRSLPSWFIYGTGDKNITEAAQEWMAKRANSRKTVAIKGASHVVMISHAKEVTTLIDDAAKFVANGEALTSAP